MNKHFIKYLIALILFGSNGIVASQIQLPSVYIVLYRAFLGCILLLLMFLLSGRKFTIIAHKKDCFFIALSGIAMGASWMLMYEAYKQIGVGVASLLYYCGPVYVMILSPVIFKENLTSQKILGFFAVLVGVVLVNGRVSGEIHTYGIVLGLASSIMCAVMIIANKKNKEIVGVENSVIQLISGLFAVLIFVLYKNGLSFLWYKEVILYGC